MESEQIVMRWPWWCGDGDGDIDGDSDGDNDSSGDGTLGDAVAV